MDKVEDIQNKFLWTRVEEKKRVTLIKWDTIYNPKSLGGLGLRKLQPFNKALIAKIGFNMISLDND